MVPADNLEGLPGITAGRVLDCAPLVWAPINLRCEAVVIVPVKDEAETICNTLRALAQQCDLYGRPLHHACYEVLLLCNNCTDASAHLVRQFARQHPTFALHIVERALPSHQANVGYARRLLMDEACRRLLAVGRPQGVICSTDGDTCATATWLAATLNAVRQGADAVGGRIIANAAGRAQMPPALRLRYLQDATYQYFAAELEAALDPDPYDPWPRHHQYFGASLALTAAMYRCIGGLPRVPVFEDMELGRTLARIDARIRHTPAVRVVTSARRAGRAGAGMAVTLAQWESLGEVPPPLRVDDLASLQARFRARRQLRVCWQGMQRGSLPASDEIALTAHAHGVEPGWLVGALKRCESFGKLHEATLARRKEEERCAASHLVAVAEAVMQLRACLSPWRAAQLRALVVRQPLPEIEPVRRRPLAHAMRETGPFPLLEEFVDTVAGQHTPINVRRPVDEEQVSPRHEARRTLGADSRQIIQ